MNRRSFLKGLGILGAAPAIVKAENIMKIWTPPKDIIIPDMVFLNGVLQSPAEMANPKFAGHYILSYFMKTADGGWENHREIQYHETPPKEIKIMFPKQFKKPPQISVSGLQLQRINHAGIY